MLKKICYLSLSSYPEDKTGGSSLYVFKLAKYFLERKFETVIIARKHQATNNNIYYYDGVLIKALSGLRFRWTKYQRPIDRSFFYPIVAYRESINECKEADLLHIVSQSLFFPIGYLVKKKYRIPIIVSIIEDLWTNLYGYFFADLYLRYQRWQLKMTLKYADGVIVHSDYILEQIKKNQPKYIQKVTRIYEGVDPKIVKSLKKQSNDLNYYENGEEKIILIAGSLVIGKNAEVVLKAIRRLKNKGFKLKLLVIGEGPLRSYLEKLSRKLGIENLVSFVGEIKHEEIARFYNFADIIVQPSKGEGSQPSPSVIEYLASGKPVIISEVCDIYGLLKDCTLRFHPNDENMLSQEIEKLLTDKDLCENLGKKGKEMVCKCFSNETFFEKFKRIYNKLI